MFFFIPSRLEFGLRVCQLWHSAAIITKIKKAKYDAYKWERIYNVMLYFSIFNYEAFLIMTLLISIIRQYQSTYLLQKELQSSYSLLPWCTSRKYRWHRASAFHLSYCSEQLEHRCGLAGVTTGADSLLFLLIKLTLYKRA